MDDQKVQTMSDEALARRDFLRKSAYAACATPVIMSLLVERANAAQSWNPGLGTRPGNQSGPQDDANRGGQGGPTPGRWDTQDPHDR